MDGNPTTLSELNREVSMTKAPTRAARFSVRRRQAGQHPSIQLRESQMPATIWRTHATSEQPQAARLPLQDSMVMAAHFASTSRAAVSTAAKSSGSAASNEQSVLVVS